MATDANRSQRLQAQAEKTLVVSSHLFGLATGFGFIKRLRNPWIRGASLAAVAATQALSERDRQIQTRKTFVDAQRAIETRGREWLHTMTVAGSDDRFQTEIELKELLEEMERPLVTLYNPNAIFYKSLIAGASLGTLQPLLYASPYVFNTYLNCLYAWSADIPPGQMLTEYWRMMFVCDTVENEGHDSSREVDALQTWRTSPLCWYGRNGKQPIFPFKVEQDQVE